MRDTKGPRMTVKSAVCLLAFFWAFLIIVVLPLHKHPSPLRGDGGAGAGGAALVAEEGDAPSVSDRPCGAGEASCRETCADLEWSRDVRVAGMDEMYCATHWHRLEAHKRTAGHAESKAAGLAMRLREVGPNGLSAEESCCLHGGGRRVFVREPPLSGSRAEGASVAPACEAFVASEFPGIGDLVASGRGKDLGEQGGKWSACTHLAVYGFNFAAFFARHLAYGLRPRSVLEFGCGLGTTSDFLARFVPGGSRVVCLEPEPMLREIFANDERAGASRPTQLAVDVFDFSSRACVDALAASKADLVLSLEVAEHLAPDRVPKLVDFLAAATGKYLVFSAARPRQGGTGHVDDSMHNWPWWREKFEAAGLVFLPRLTAGLRLSALPDRPYDIHQNVIAMGVPGAVDRSDVPDEAFEGWGCALMPSFICGDSKETRAAEGKKRRAMLEGMWMALWPEVDIMVRRLKTKDLSCA